MAEIIRVGTVLLGEQRVAYRLTGGDARAAAAAATTTPTATTTTTVVLLNGSVFNYRQWNPVLLPLLRWRLGAAWRFLQLDYPGFGGSPAGPPIPTMAAAAALVAQLLDALGIDRAHLLGISLGSALGQALLFERPERVLSFAGFGNPHLGDPAHARHLTTSLRPCRHLEALEPLRRLRDSPIDLSTAGLLLREVYCPRIFGKPVDRLSLRERVRLRAIQLLVARMLIGTPLRSVFELFARQVDDAAALVEYYHRGLAAAPPVPALLLCGLEDRTTPPAMSRALQRALPTATVVELPGVDHTGPMLVPQQAWRIVAAYAPWVSRLAAEREACAADRPAVRAGPAGRADPALTARPARVHGREAG